MVSKINIKNIPIGYQSFISNGRHAIVGDEPVNSKGTDLGLSPQDLLLSSISMCKVATIRNVARRKNIEIGNVDASLKQTIKRQKDGSFKIEINSAINIEGNITEEQRKMLIEEADNCFITRVVKGEWEIKKSEALDMENKAEAT
jgi:Predicted redox protein, regulator of disulfide bond formation